MNGASALDRGPNGGTNGFRTSYISFPRTDNGRRDARWLVHRATRLTIWLYMRLFHAYRVRYHVQLPRGEPFIVVNHSSYLDVPALMAMDPWYPPTTMIIKEEVLKVPVLSWVLRRWGAISVARAGRDLSAIRAIRAVLDRRSGICAAPQGTRSRDARLAPISPVLIRIILQSKAVFVPMVVAAAALRVRAAIEALLPSYMHHAPATPLLAR